MKWIGWAGAAAGAYYLYVRNLGSIPFLLLSIYFFRKAKKILSNPNDRNHSINRTKKVR